MGVASDDPSHAKRDTARLPAGPEITAVDSIGGPVWVAWREGTLTRAEELEALCAWVTAAMTRSGRTMIVSPGRPVSGWKRWRPAQMRSLPAMAGKAVASSWAWLVVWSRSAGSRSEPNIYLCYLHD